VSVGKAAFFEGLAGEKVQAAARHRIAINSHTYRKNPVKGVQ
jgi:hypothetical protein